MFTFYINYQLSSSPFRLRVIARMVTFAEYFRVVLFWCCKLDHMIWQVGVLEQLVLPFGPKDFWRFNILCNNVQARVNWQIHIQQSATRCIMYFLCIVIDKRNVYWSMLYLRIEIISICKIDAVGKLFTRPGRHQQRHSDKYYSSSRADLQLDQRHNFRLFRED